jgi:hypothetical protein
MTENAIVRKSGQYWKWVLFQCLGVGSALLIFGGGAFRGYGVLLGLFAFIFVNAAIRFGWQLAPKILGGNAHVNWNIVLGAPPNKALHRNALTRVR